MKSSKLLKTISLCIGLFIVIVAKAGDNTIKTITIAPSNTLTVTYGNSVTKEYTINITPQGGQGNATSITYTLSLTGLGTDNQISYQFLSGTTFVTGSMNGNTVSLKVNITNEASSLAKGYKIGITASSTKHIISTSTTDYIISKAQLFVTGTSTVSKMYDGYTNATFTGGILSGVFNNEDVSLDHTGIYDNKNVGTIKVVTCNIQGAKAANYLPPTVNGIITAKPITVVNTIINDKVYDGKTTATIKTAGSLYGIVSGETNIPTLTESYTFPDQNIGLKTLNANCSISGGGGNYILSQQPTTFTASITPKPLTVTGASVASRVFDGTASATINGGVLAGLVAGEETVVELVNPGTGTFSDANPGINKSVTANYSITGAGIANYAFTQPALQGMITAPTAVVWSGTTSDWGTSANWTPPYVPDASVDVTIASGQPQVAPGTPAACKNLTLQASGTLTIQPQGSLTVNGNLVNDATAEKGLSLLSDALHTGSMIVYGTATGAGTASVERYMAPNYWHLVSSPLSEQTAAAFLQANPSIPINKEPSAPKVFPLERGMRAYNGQLIGGWSDFLKEDSQEKLSTGRGFSIRVKGTTGTQRVTFTGMVQPGPHSVPVVPEYWNCVGNPYTSALNVSGTGTSFLSENITSMPAAFQCVYVWDAASDAYTQLNGTNMGNVQQGQAFMVVLAPGNPAVSFTPAMQTHEVALTLKSTENVWPSIQLQVSDDSLSSATVVAFHEGMTPGLDPSYDAGLLSAGGPIELYTRLVDDYGIPFDIQALPLDQYEQLVIPVGLDYPKGGKVTFSASGQYLPTSCRPVLEDRLLGTLTDLTDTTYTTQLDVNTKGTGRFYLHTSATVLGADSPEKHQPLLAWVTENHEINIKGQINNGAVASLFDLQGRLILTREMREGTREHISLPAVKGGIYLLQVRDARQVQRIKLTIGQY